MMSAMRHRPVTPILKPPSTAEAFGRHISGRLRNRLGRMGITNLSELRVFVETEGGWAKLQSSRQVGPAMIAEAADLLDIANPFWPEPAPGLCPHCGQPMAESREAAAVHVD
jgi:hypothetical protein